MGGLDWTPPHRPYSHHHHPHRTGGNHASLRYSPGDNKTCFPVLLIIVAKCSLLYTYTNQETEQQLYIFEFHKGSKSLIWIQEFILVLPSASTTEAYVPKLQAQLPDLCNFCCNPLTVCVCWQVFPFTSESKRMGIIVRDTASKEILFYMKGADTVMSSIGKSASCQSYLF